MLETKNDELQVITESISGKRPVDSETLSSVAVLAERLERLKQSNELFADISFSPYVKELASKSTVTTLC